MEKEIKLDNERNLEVIIDEENNNKLKQIKESFAADGLTCAHYLLSRNGSFKFNAQLDLDLISEENKNNLIFEIDKDHLLYNCYLDLLNNDKELVIYDDNSKEKYLTIKDEENLISLTFVDKTKEKELSDKFSISCSNQLDYFTDKKSIKNNELKMRLACFFDETCDLLIYGSHQISMDEYSLRKKIV